MTKPGIKALGALAAVLLAPAAGYAQEPSDVKPVTFTAINDAVPDKFFDAASTVPDLADPNVLVIGFNSGRDPVIWKDREFKASLLAYSYQSATDTISFVITAPDGYFISGIFYKETIVLGNSRQGRGFAATQLVVNGVATDDKVVDLTAAAPTRVPMSITTSLVAANADARLVAGRVIVAVEPLPDPPALPDVQSLVELPGIPETPAAVESIETAPASDVPELPAAVSLDAAVVELPGAPVELPAVPAETTAPGGEGSEAR